VNRICHPTVALIAICLLAGYSCSGGTGSTPSATPVENLSQSEYGQLLTTITAQATLNFAPLVPKYVPNGLDLQPNTVDGRDNGVTVLFDASSPDRNASFSPVTLNIIQSYGADQSILDSLSSEIDGVPVHEDAGSPGQDATLHEFSAWVGKRYFQVDLTWYGSESDRGRTETLLVTRSLIDQAKSQQ
jgi:hypothetical protein